MGGRIEAARRFRRPPAPRRRVHPGSPRDGLEPRPQSVIEHHLRLLPNGCSVERFKLFRLTITASIRPSAFRNRETMQTESASASRPPNDGMRRVEMNAADGVRWEEVQPSDDGHRRIEDRLTPNRRPLLIGHVRHPREPHLGQGRARHASVSGQCRGRRDRDHAREHNESLHRERPFKKVLNRNRGRPRRPHHRSGEIGDVKRPTCSAPSAQRCAINSGVFARFRPTIEAATVGASTPSGR